MTREELTELLANQIGRIAPEIEFSKVDPSEDLRDAFEIDSMDFLNLVTALHERLNIEIPEKDYDQLGTVNAFLDYLVRETAQTGD